jgi:V/A-type H+/Na+-transporting ATPase subunit I
MAFEAFYKIQFVITKSHLVLFRNYLHKKGVIHLKDISQLNKSLPIALEKSTEEELDRKIESITYLLKFIDKENPPKTSFIENFIPNRPIILQNKIYSIENSLDPITLDQTLQRDQKSYQQIQDAEHLIVPQLAYLHCLKDTGIDFSVIKSFHYISVKFYESNGVAIEELQNHPYIAENAIVIDYRENSPMIRVHIVICAKKIEPELDILLNKFGLTIFDVSGFEETPEKAIQVLYMENKTLEQKQIKTIEAFKKIIPLKENLIVLKDLTNNQKERNICTQKFAQTKHAVYIEGFIPCSKVEKFTQECKKDYPDVLIETFPTDEPAPIKFINNRFFKPFEFIIRMFGIPRYGMIDPTPFISITFLILFGLAFGDVIYGLFLMAFCWWGIKKFKYDKGTVNFFKMFLFAGISATLFGAFTASWAGDLVSETYLPKNNFLVQLKNKFVMVNSIDQIMTLLVIILYIGLAVQMLGVFMAFLQNIKEKNYIDAIFDQISWLIFLPCAFFFAGNFLVKGYYPPLLIIISVIGLMVSLLMIFYGGFRQSSRPAIKILKGFVNIYGIVSSYGIASILGDVLSYLRLLALAIATSSMAISFNLISFLLKDVKIFGPILVVVLLIFTNIFNLLLSILGAFIHPVRLLFFEFFGRFFQDGGTEYKPFSYQFKNIIVKGGELE